MQPAALSLADPIELRPGLVALCSDKPHLHGNDEVERVAGLSIVLVLEGGIDLSYGRMRCQVAARAARPEGALVALTEPDAFVRRDRGGGAERKISLLIEPQWLSESGLDAEEGHRDIQHFCRRHLALARWRPSARLQAAAEQMLRPPALLPALQRLYLESRAIELAAEALGSLAGGTAPGAASRPAHERRRMAGVRALLDSGEADDWPLDRIAREFGLHESTLQRQFRAAYGSSVFDHQRRRRLDAARLALADGMTVTEAAYAAGYASPANFATAFKRRFGMAPSQVRQRR